MLPERSGFKWALLLALTLLVYLALLPVWWYTLTPLTVLVATISNGLYQFFNPDLQIAPSGRSLSFVVTAEAANGMTAQANSRLSLDKWTYGLPILAALVLTTRADALKLKLKALGFGLGAMLGLGLVTILLWGRMVELQLAEQIAQAATGRAGGWSGIFNSMLHGYADAQPVVAVFTWLALLLLGQFRMTHQPTAARTKTRNDLCSCGSGKKYKRCCGR